MHDEVALPTTTTINSKRQCVEEEDKAAHNNNKHKMLVGLVVVGDEDTHFDPCRASYEKPMRIAAITKLLEQRFPELNMRLVRVEPRLALDAELLCAHTKPYLSKLNRMIASSNDNFECNLQAQDEFDSIYMNKNSLLAAKMSAGAAMECIDTLFALPRNTLRATAAAIRPPGHHAENHCAMGFCFFNNAALAAKRALLQHSVQRVVIVDFDIHHGNSTQRMFWDDDRVVYISIHRWDRGRFYPAIGLEASGETVGVNGKTVNIAFSDGDMGDLEYRAAVEAIVVPIISEFKPQLIVFSAGFDVLHGDPIGRYHVSPQGLGCLVDQALLAAGRDCRAALLLEGGYSTAATAEGFCACLQALDQGSGPWPEFKLWNRVKQQAVDSINSTIAAQAKYWPGLKSVRHCNEDGGRTVV